MYTVGEITRETAEAMFENESLQRVLNQNGIYNEATLIEISKEEAQSDIETESSLRDQASQKAEDLVSQFKTFVNNLDDDAGAVKDIVLENADYSNPESLMPFFTAVSEAYDSGYEGRPMNVDLVGDTNYTVLEQAQKAGIKDRYNAQEAQETGGSNESEEGKLYLRGGSERAYGENTGKQTRSVGERAGEKAPGRSEQGLDEGNGKKNSGTNGKEISAVDLKLKDGTDKTKVRLWGDVLKPDMKTAKELATKHGLKTVFFYGNNLSTGTKEGNVRGFIRGNTIYIRADHPYFTPEQIVRHELFHRIVADQNDSVHQQTVDRLWNDLRHSIGRENLNELLEHYKEAYWTEEMLQDADEKTLKAMEQALMEEILADMYAGINTFRTASRYAAYWDTVDGILDSAQLFRDYAESEAEGKIKGRNRENGVAEQFSEEIVPYSQKEKDFWGNSKKIVVYDGTAAQIVDFVKKALSDGSFKRKMYFGKISGVLADRIQRETGISALGKNITLYADNIRKVQKDHGNADGESKRGQRAVVSTDYAKIPEIIVNAQKLIAGTYEKTGKPSVTFEWKKENERYNLVLVENGQSMDIFVQTFYINIKKGSIARLDDAQGSKQTSETTSGTASTDNINQLHSESQAETINMSSEIEETDRFIAWHNMTEDALESALELGGIAMPSFAVKKADSVHSDYGPISVIAERASIEPNGRDQRLYAGDAWTPVFPEVNYKINESETDRIYNHIYSILQKAGVNPSEFHIGLDSSNLLDKLQRNNGSFSKAMQNNEGMKLAFLKDSGIGIEIPSTEKKFSQYASNETLKRIAKEFDLSKLDSDKIRALEPALLELIHEDAKNRKGEKYADLLYPLDQQLGFSKADNILRNAVRISEAANTKKVDTYALKDRIKEIMTPEVEKRYTTWLDTLGKNVISGKGIRNNVDTYTANGNRRSFDQLHYEYNLSNIVRAMKSQPKQGRTQFLSGPGSVKGAALKNYEDIEAARAEISRLSEKEKIRISEAYAAFEEHVLKLSNRVAKDPFTGTEILADIFSHAKTKDQIMHYMVKEYSKVFKPTNALTNEIYELIQEANNLPMEYFEAKLYRAFPITEAAAYIVPDTMNEVLRQRLEDTGATVLQYEAGNEEDRLAKANSVPEVQFSEEIPEYNKGAQTEEQKAFLRNYSGRVTIGGSKKIRVSKSELAIISTSVKQGFALLNSGATYGSIDTANNTYRFRVAGEDIVITARMRIPEYSDTVERVRHEEFRGTDSKDSSQNKGTENDGRRVRDASKGSNRGGLKYDGRMAGQSSGGNEGRGLRSDLEDNGRSLGRLSDEQNSIKEAGDENSRFFDAKTSEELSPFAGEPYTLTEAKQMLNRVMKENEKLRAENEYWKGQTKTTVAHLDPKSAQRWTKKIVKEYGTDIDSEKVAAALTEAGRLYIEEYGKTETPELELKIRDALRPAAEEIILHAKEKTEEDKSGYELLRSVLKAGIKLSDQDKSNIADLNHWKKVNIGYVTLTDKGQPMDSLYMELQDEFGRDLFPDEIMNPADQLVRAVEVLKDLKGVYENPFQSFDMAEALTGVTDDLMTSLYNGMIRQTDPTYADKMEAKLARERANTARKIEEAVAENQKKNDRTIEELKHYYKENTKQAVRAQKLQDMSERDRISKNEKLRRLIRRLRNRKLSAVNRARIDEIIGELDTEYIRLTGDKLEELQSLDDFIRDNDDVIFPEHTKKAVASLRKKHIGELTQEEVATLTEALLSIETEIANANKQIDAEDKRETFRQAFSVMNDIRNTRGTHPGFIRELHSALVLNTLSPERFGRTITGYADGDPLQNAFYDLTKGETKMIDHQMKAYGLFDKWTNDRTLMKKWQGRHADVITVNGQGRNGSYINVEITPAMRVSLYMHSLNDDNMRHIQYGGVKIPDMKLYKAGKFADAYSEGQVIRFTRADIRAEDAPSGLC